VEDSQHALTSAKAAYDLTCARPLADALKELRNDGHRNICADEGGANVREPGLEVRGTDASTPREPAE
jgi:hypothetical protein